MRNKEDQVPLGSLDNVVVTPHIGYVTERMCRMAWQRMAQDVAAGLSTVGARRLITT